jgi:hypothetical protein
MTVSYRCEGCGEEVIRAARDLSRCAVAALLAVAFQDLYGLKGYCANSALSLDHLIGARVIVGGLA